MSLLPETLRTLGRVPPYEERRHLQEGELIYQHLALASEVNLVAQHAQVCFQVAW